MQSSLFIHSIGDIHKSPTTPKTTPFRNNRFGCNSDPLQLSTLPLVPHHRFGCNTYCSSSIFPIWTVTNYQRRRRTRTEATPSPLNDSATPPNSNGSSGGFASAAELVSAAFPLWVTLACLIALFKPSSFSWLTPRLQVPGITLTMLGFCLPLNQSVIYFVWVYGSSQLLPNYIKMWSLLFLCIISDYLVFENPMWWWVIDAVWVSALTQVRNWLVGEMEWKGHIICLVFCCLCFFLTSLCVCICFSIRYGNDFDTWWSAGRLCYAKGIDLWLCPAIFGRLKTCLLWNFIWNCFWNL